MPRPTIVPHPAAKTPQRRHEVVGRRQHATLAPRRELLRELAADGALQALERSTPQLYGTGPWQQSEFPHTWYHDYRHLGVPGRLVVIFEPGTSRISATAQILGGEA